MTAPATDAATSRAAPILPYRWQKGAPSPNPGGKTKAMAECQAIARERSVEAVTRLADLIQSPQVLNNCEQPLLQLLVFPFKSIIIIILNIAYKS